MSKLEWNRPFRQRQAQYQEDNGSYYYPGSEPQGIGAHSMSGAPYQQNYSAGYENHQSSASAPYADRIMKELARVCPCHMRELPCDRCALRPMLNRRSIQEIIDIGGHTYATEIQHTYRGFREPMPHKTEIAYYSGQVLNDPRLESWMVSNVSSCMILLPASGANGSERMLRVLDRVAVHMGDRTGTSGLDNVVLRLNFWNTRNSGSKAEAPGPLRYHPLRCLIDQLLQHHRPNVLIPHRPESCGVEWEEHCNMFRDLIVAMVDPPIPRTVMILVFGLSVHDDPEEIARFFRYLCVLPKRPLPRNITLKILFTPPLPNALTDLIIWEDSSMMCIDIQDIDEAKDRQAVGRAEPCTCSSGRDVEEEA